jgi:hypothetical protein
MSVFAYVEDMKRETVSVLKNVAENKSIRGIDVSTTTKSRFYWRSLGNNRKISDNLKGCKVGDTIKVISDMLTDGTLEHLLICNNALGKELVPIFASLSNSNKVQNIIDTKGKLYWRLCRNIVVVDDHPLLQYCDRISNTISLLIFDRSSNLTFVIM